MRPESNGSGAARVDAWHINHGTQLKRDAEAAHPTSYFGYQLRASIGRFAGLERARADAACGILGLGAGVTATLANAGDTLHYYEINSLVARLASHRVSSFGTRVRPR